MIQVPASRTITPETATEFEVIDGRSLPSNDGRDVEGWEYKNMRAAGSTSVTRIPVRYDPPEDRPTHEAYADEWGYR